MNVCLIKWMRQPSMGQIQFVTCSIPQWWDRTQGNYIATYHRKHIKYPNPVLHINVSTEMSWPWDVWIISITRRLWRTNTKIFQSLRAFRLAHSCFKLSKGVCKGDWIFDEPESSSPFPVVCLYILLCQKQLNYTWEGTEAGQDWPSMVTMWSLALSQSVRHQASYE